VFLFALSCIRTVCVLAKNSSHTPGHTSGKIPWWKCQRKAWDRVLYTLWTDVKAKLAIRAQKSGWTSHYFENHTKGPARTQDKVICLVLLRKQQVVFSIYIKGWSPTLYTFQVALKPTVVFWLKWLSLISEGWYAIQISLHLFLLVACFHRGVGHIHGHLGVVYFGKRQPQQKKHYQLVVAEESGQLRRH